MTLESPELLRSDELSILITPFTFGNVLQLDQANAGGDIFMRLQT